MTEALNGTPEKNLIIFDTTLRDGSQMPGISFTPEDKVEIALQLAEIGVDVIEAGFPFSSQENFEATRRVAETVVEPVICAFTGAWEGDIEKAYEAIEPAKHHGGARLNTCLPISELHMRTRLEMEPEEVLQLAVKSVKRAKSLTDDVEFSAEDASRADVAFLKRVVLEVANAGATTIMVPDTVGKAFLNKYAELTSVVRETLDQAGLDSVVVAAHTHNDMGLATSNAILAILNGGAGQVDVTAGGVGERAGNADLAQLAAIAHECPELGIYTGIDTTKLTHLVRDVASRGGVHLQHHLPIIGRNAFRHASGMHQDGIVKDPETFEYLHAEDYGQVSGQFVINTQSGKAGVRRRLEGIAISVEADDLLRLRNDVENLSSQVGRDLADSDLEELYAELSGEELTDEIQLDLDQLTEETVKGISTVSVLIDGVRTTASSAKGPVDAATIAINEATGLDGNIEEWTADAPEPDSGSTVGVLPIISLNGYEVKTYAVERSSDFASIAAYVKGLNIIRRAEKRASAAVY